MMAKATASFLPPSGYHEIEQTVRFTSAGSWLGLGLGLGLGFGLALTLTLTLTLALALALTLNTESVLAEGGSLEWSAYSPAKYSCHPSRAWAW